MQTRISALGIIGAGCIGRRVASEVAHGKLPYTVAVVNDVDPAAAESLVRDYAPQAQVLPLDGLCAACDVVLEAAAGAAVPGVIAEARRSHLAAGRPSHVLVMSVGGLLGVPFEGQEGPVVHVPSGALGGLDAVQALAVAGLDEVSLVTRKPPMGLGEAVAGPAVLFEGPAREVIEKFPKNINVAIALSFAGLGPDRTKVTLIADPGVTRNTHHVFARGPAGEVEFESRNLPFPDNPRTSYLAALSAIALLKRLGSILQVG